VSLDLHHVYSGKVRDLYQVDEFHLLMVASDRMSAFDVVMSETIPEKGRVLTGLTNYWLREFTGQVRRPWFRVTPRRSISSCPDFSSRRSGTVARCWYGVLR